MDVIRFNGTGSTCSLFIPWGRQSLSFCGGGLRTIDFLMGTACQFGHISCTQLQANRTEQTLDLVVWFCAALQFLTCSLY